MFLHNVRRAAPLLILLCCCVLLLTSAGCGPVRARPVEVGLARETLLKVLDHWKQGGTIDELRRAKPEIVAQEPLWSGGNQLIEYEMTGEGQEEDANWYCEVKLTLQSTDRSKPIKKTVTYVVGTDPVLTVFHAIL